MGEGGWVGEHIARKLHEMGLATGDSPPNMARAAIGRRKGVIRSAYIIT